MKKNEILLKEECVDILSESFDEPEIVYNLIIILRDRFKKKDTISDNLIFEIINKFKLEKLHVIRNNWILISRQIKDQAIILMAEKDNDFIQEMFDFLNQMKNLILKMIDDAVVNKEELLNSIKSLENNSDFSKTILENKNEIINIFNSYSNSNDWKHFFKSEEDFNYSVDIIAKYFTNTLDNNNILQIKTNKRTKTKLSKALTSIHRECTEKDYSKDLEFHKVVLKLFPAIFKDMVEISNISKNS